MENKNSKETINLLDLLSETESDLSDLILATPKKKKIKRRHKSGVRSKSTKGFCSCNNSKTRIISIWLAAIFIIFWLIALSWLAVFLYREIGKMDSSIRSAIAGSEGVPDALQKCHSLSKELQNNQTILFTQLADVKLQITNFTIQLTYIQQSLPQVQEVLNRAPELSNVFKDLKDIRNSVAEFGSKIQDLRNTADSFKAVDNKIQDAQIVLQKNITDIKSTVTELSKVTQAPEVLTNTSKLKTEELSQAISKLKADLSSANETLTSSLTWVQDDQKKYKKTLDDLQDKTMNVKMKLESLQGECAKASEQESILTSINNLTKEVKNAHTLDDDLNGRINQLEQNYSHLKNSTDVILNSINEAKTSSTKSSEQTTVKSEPSRS